MLQIDHIYRFLYENLFNDFVLVHPKEDGVTLKDPTYADINVYYKDMKKFKSDLLPQHVSTISPVIFSYDQEPLLSDHIAPYLNLILNATYVNEDSHHVLVSSEKSDFNHSSFTKHLYYFFHGFASLDWFRGYHALNYTKNPIRDYKYDYQSFNRIVTGDRAYRKTFVDQLRVNNLLDHGAVSYGVTDDTVTEERLVIDHEQLSGSASADIPNVDAFWHVVTETVFSHRKLHLTEKIFKPIVSKQPFMLLAAPGNLEYLKSYGFETFNGIIDERYDPIADDSERIDAVVKQLKWYCDLDKSDKRLLQQDIAPIVEHNFHHFYGKFKEIITDELLDNTKQLFKDIGYDDRKIDYDTIRKLLIS